jgi:poly-gamma-glutamate capsule biosynthesis protein CapA/YwtB (metallophosphatase superfamily)
MKKFYLIFPPILLSFFFLSYFPEEIGNTPNPQADSTVTVTISVVGDIMCHSVQYNYSRVNADSFNFDPVYREVKKYLEESDFTFGNFETVTAGKGKGYSGYPLFNTPDDFIPALKNAGFDMLSTSNNHSLDRGEFGVRRTIEQMINNGLYYNGTYTSQADRDSVRIFNIKGLSVAFLDYTFGTNGNPIPRDKPWLINLIDYNLIEKDIKEARKRGAELVIVHYHYGEEYKREPIKSQQDVVNKTIQLGADIIIGGHPHVLQPVNYFKTSNAKLDTGFVAYSMGNFFSNQRWRFSDAGAILTLRITRNIATDSIYISGVDYIPTWVFKGNTSRGREYIILPAGSDNLSYLTANDISLMKQAFDDTKKTFTLYTGKIQLHKLTGN